MRVALSFALAFSVMPFVRVAFSQEMLPAEPLNEGREFNNLNNLNDFNNLNNLNNLNGLNRDLTPGAISSPTRLVPRDVTPQAISSPTRLAPRDSLEPAER
jgi:hypothetical protein